MRRRRMSCGSSVLSASDRLAADLDRGDRPWRKIARPKQQPPGGPWNIWILLAGRGFGKLLDVATPVPTPSGWVKLEEIQAGDEVFDEAGRTCRVVKTFDAVPGVAYRVRFSDGSEIDACGDHQWVTWTHRDRKAYLRSLYEDHSRFPAEWPQWRALRVGRLASGQPRVCPDSPGPQIRTTQQIADTLTIGARGDLNHCIPVCGPLQLPDADLPVHPYVLGAWLGDGTRRTGYLTIGPEDAAEMTRLLEACGETVTPCSQVNTFLISGQPRVRDAMGRMAGNGSLRSGLAALGMDAGKHVPAVYLRASAGQRLALLQGLMDSDGYAEASKAEFCNTNKMLIDAVTELARSLGQKPVVYAERSRLYGRDCGPKWRVNFRPTIQVFRLPRKMAKFSSGGAQSLRNHHRMIVSVQRIDPKPMRCLTVDSRNSMFLAGEAMIPTHNTWVGSNWIAEQAMSTAHSEWAVVAPTFRDVRKTCIEGPTGILKGLQPGELSQYNRAELKLILSNGSRIYGYSADQPERLRGANLNGAWCDELASWRYPDTWIVGLVPALRIGKHPRVVVTTTPRPTRLVRDLVSRDDGSVHVTRGSTWENADNLSAAALTELRRRYDGTRMGRQELEGELLADTEGALWTRDVIEAGRIGQAAVPALTRVVVAVDPAVTSGEGADETGIIVAGEDGTGHGYILDDRSVRGTPDYCMRAAVRAFEAHKADRIVGEANNGGDFIGSLLATVDPGIPYRKVVASRGKAIRAEPVSALYEQKRVHHVGIFPQLEDELCTWTPIDPKSPNRLDAAVWAITELRGLSAGSWHACYGTMMCPACGRGFMREQHGKTRENCPHCRAPVEQDDYAPGPLTAVT